MSDSITLIDCGIGNINSVKNMLQKVGVRNVQISTSEKDIAGADKLILPGVGSFDYGMSKLKEFQLIDVLNDKVLKQKTPILGICLGAQLLTKSSEEGVLPGLGWIDAHTKRFKFAKGNEQKIPHMGWNEVIQAKKSKLLENMDEEARFYFIHSYHIVCNNSSDELLKAVHGYEITAAVEHENVVGVQFHPEKSHKFGLKLLHNFVHNF